MKRIVVSALAALSLAACSKQPTVTEVADAAGNGSVALVKEANGSFGELAGGSTATTLGQLVDRANHTGLLPSLRALPRPATQVYEKTALAHVVTGAVDVPTGTDVDARAEALGKFLRERIFTQENLESSGDDGLIFRIMGDDVCSDGTTPADPACVQSWDRFEVRVRVTSGVLGYEFYLELGPNRAEPFEAVLSESLIGAGVDLPGVKASLEYVNSVTGEATYVPQTFEGNLFVSLKKNGEKDFTLSSSVREAIRIEAENDSGPVRFSTEAKDPWFMARIQAKAHTLSAALDLGVTDAQIPYVNLSASGSAGHELALHLGGASASVELSESALSVAVTHIGLGDETSYLALDGTHLLDVDLNPDSGRHFDVNVGYSAADQNVSISVSPEVDLTTHFNYGPLTADPDVSVPPYAMDSTYRFQFNGSSPTLVPSGTGFKVTSGTLRLENTAHADQAVVVDAGRCLVEVTPADGADPLIGSYAAQDCP